MRGQAKKDTRQEGWNALSCDVVLWGGYEGLMGHEAVHSSFQPSSLAALRLPTLAPLSVCGPVPPFACRVSTWRILWIPCGGLIGAAISKFGIEAMTFQSFLVFVEASTSGSKTLCQTVSGHILSSYATMTEKPERIYSRRAAEASILRATGLTHKPAAAGRALQENLCWAVGIFKVLDSGMRNNLKLFETLSMRTCTASYHHFDIEVLRHVAGIEFGEFNAEERVWGHPLPGWESQENWKEAAFAFKYWSRPAQS